MGTGTPAGTKELTREQTRTRHAGTGTGMAENTRGLPVSFTSLPCLPNRMSRSHPSLTIAHLDIKTLPNHIILTIRLCTAPPHRIESFADRWVEEVRAEGGHVCSCVVGGWDENEEDGGYLGVWLWQA